MSKLWRNLHDEVHEALGNLEASGHDQMAQEAWARILEADECNLVAVYQELHDFTRPFMQPSKEEAK